MNKTELAGAVAAKAGLTKVAAKAAVDATLKAIAEELKAGNKVQLLGFGTFSVAKRPARKGVNPKTGKKITIAAKKVAKFKAGAAVAKTL
ncbi:MAG: HU family DNA-binding protein [Bacteroidaceae bacterium]|nr:HU family DNA-binding protein [Bacteroidaceae bacterium]